MSSSLDRRELLAVPMQGTISPNEIYSGVARLAGILWCVRHRAHAHRLSETVVLVVHPSSNFMGHYSLDAFADAGVDAVGMTTRYIGNDTNLLLENCVLDIASVISHLRAQGYLHVVLFGNSGGGSLAALYQSQSEKPTITGAPGGGGPDLTQQRLPPADSLVLAMAHPGRAQLLAETLDPSIRDEADPYDRDPALDMFNRDNGPAYDPSWLVDYRKAQRARNDSISDWAEAQLPVLAEHGVPDLPFVVHGVCADPRFLDMTIEPSDREPGTLWGEAWAANFQPTTLGHFTTVRAWMSQWSLRHSNGNALDNLGSVTVPVHVIYGTADQSCYPSHARSMYECVPHDAKQLTVIYGGRHYLNGQPAQVRQLVEAVLSFASHPGDHSTSAEGRA